MPIPDSSHRGDGGAESTLFPEVEIATIFPVGTILELARSNRESIEALVRAHKGLSVAVFGSAARGEESEASDLDLLVQFGEGSSLFDLMELESEISALLGISVDVVSVGGLKPRDEHIRREAVPL